MKNKNKKPKLIAFRPGFIIYFLVLITSLVFTQALRSPASAILFVFLLILPVISLIYLLIARAAIKVYTECDNTRAEKRQPVSYEIKFINESPLPFPFVETVVSLPSENAVVCQDKLMRITLLPMGAHIVNNNVSFPLRGSYDIGVKYMYIGDLFGMFRTEMKLELHRTVIVYPRNIILSADTNRNDTDLPTSVTKRSVSPEQAEPADIRNYIPGDSMKNIHWKLSSKAEELQVKNYSSNTDKHTYIFCDLSFSGAERHDLTKKEKGSAAGKKNRKLRRRGKVEQSAAVKSARSVGDIGGNPEPYSESHDTKERLEALGVTSDYVTAVGNLNVMDEMTIEESAGRKGAKNAKRLAAERMARLASMIVEGEHDGAPKSVHSVFKSENLPFAGELCADSVIELALSAMRYEVSRGADCTILYPDKRSDNGFGVLSSANDIPEDPSLIKFFTAPVCCDRDSFAKLAMMVEGNAGLTIRMVTANTDIYSAATFAAIPATFGGAGTGCIAEVMLASPENLWNSENDRGISADSMRSELSRSSVGMRRFTVENGADGGLRFTSGI